MPTVIKKLSNCHLRSFGYYCYCRFCSSIYLNDTLIENVCCPDEHCPKEIMPAFLTVEQVEVHITTLP